MANVAPRAIIRPEQLPNRVRQDPSRSAEVRIYDGLRVQLGPGWRVFYSVAWLAPAHDGTPSDGEADFVVAHPERGVLVIEVKGGRIRYDADAGWISRDRGDTDHEIDPFRQVVRSKHALLGRLKALSSLRDTFIGIGHAVAFPLAERPRVAVTPDAPPEIIIGMDDLERLPERIEEILGYWDMGRGGHFSEGDRIVDGLSRILGKSTELRNPLALQTAEDEREIVKLTEEQFTLLDRLSRVRRAAIGGCAGAGKTFLAVEKAKRLAGEEFRTLLTCYNRALGDHLARAAAGVDNLDVVTIHTLARRLAREAGVPTGAFEDDPTALLEAAQRLPDARYDAIVVDEGQDFDETWWVALEALLADGDRGILYVFYDDHQQLYRGRASLPDGLVDIPLTENIRNTRAIFDVLARHYRGEQPIRPRGPVGRVAEFIRYEPPAGLKDQLAKVLHRLLIVEGFAPADLVVLTPKALERSALPTLPLPGGLQLVTEEPAGPHRILCTTIHSFKGLERRVAIVAELDEDFLRYEELDRARLLYVALSRPRTHLIVLGTSRVLDELFPVGR